MSPQTKEELQDAMKAGEVGTLCGIANFLKCRDEAIDLQFREAHLEVNIHHF